MGIQKKQQTKCTMGMISKWNRLVSHPPPPSPMFLTLGLCYASIANKTRSEEIVNQMHTGFFFNLPKHYDYAMSES